VARDLTRSGTDEAGRGSIVGPLVIASVLVDVKGIRKLRECGVKDSKKLSPSRRRALVPFIEDASQSCIVTYVTPSNVDEYVRRRRKYMTLNKLEAEVAAAHLRFLRPSVAYLDSPYPIPKVFKRMVKGALDGMKVRIVSENRSESAHVEVAAASVLAKVRRDELVGELRARIGDFGSGYPSDPRTRRFISDLISRRERPSFVRWSWKTVDRLVRPARYPSSETSATK